MSATTTSNRCDDVSSTHTVHRGLLSPSCPARVVSLHVSIEIFLTMQSGRRVRSFVLGSLCSVESASAS